MNHKPIQFKDLSLISPHKTCFEFLSSEVGDCITLIGPYGSGKSGFDHNCSIHIETKNLLLRGNLPRFNEAHVEVIPS
ncbi:MULTISPECIES: hypothetical protein [Legionella]|uniref:Uncharacterized protein n=1 Tax=Legionella resiliens TaxID=2905958 RepID=A0ABS8WZ44_9GAMM|nr:MULTISPECIES: hypothetical protein [unclassified Legionella]MCE0721820.1 hypothetical protein [Legionella sp. 9fVS26]MCE3530974.1 hypothetical protein [Legionella sp. 8cVS16]QLZ70536.1 hypothetical protein FOLKNPGA_03350 [Legionella sp. PC1000]